MGSPWVVIPAPLLLGLESQVRLVREVSGDKGTGWLSSAQAQSPGASVEAFLHLLIWKRVWGGGTILSSQPKTKVHLIPQPPFNYSLLGTLWGNWMGRGPKSSAQGPIIGRNLRSALHTPAGHRSDTLA